MGHWRSAQDPAVLAQLLREHGHPHLRDRLGRPEALRGDRAGAAGAAGGGEAGRGAAPPLRQQAGPDGGRPRLHHRGGARAAHHQGQGVADTGREEAGDRVHTVDLPSR